MTAIPKIVHMIWVGDKPSWLGPAVKRWHDSLGDDWELRLWDETSEPMVRNVWDYGQSKGLSVRGTTDLMRLAIMQEYGGVYMDTDTVPLRLENLEQRRAWIGTQPGGAPLSLPNGHFGFPAGHPFVRAVWHNAQDAISRGNRDDHFVAGPRTWAKTYREHSYGVWQIPKFPTIEAGSLPRLFAQGADLDIEALRAEHETATVLHILYSRKHVK